MMEFHRIVVGVDFSAASIAAARWATALAPRAEIVLVHVLPKPEAPPFLRPYLPPMLDVVTELAPSLYGGLRGVAELIDAGRTRIDMREGRPADGLAAAAAEVGADLVCLGRTRSRRGSARFGATTAQRLLARTGLSVLVVPAARDAQGTATERAAPPGRILAAVDGGAGGPHVTQAAWRLALASEARVDALHVLGPELHALARACRIADADAGSDSRALPPTGEPGRWLRVEEELLGVTRAWLEDQLQAAGAPPTRAGATVRVGDPGQEIVAFARTAGVGLIVAGRGDRADAPTVAPRTGAPPGGIGPPGSTTRLAIWAAPCPVLVLPAASAPQDPTPPPRRSARLRHLDAQRWATTLAERPSPGPPRPAAARRAVGRDADARARVRSVGGDCMTSVDTGGRSPRRAGERAG
jgi:nucleotide-binding universal stress UspA family protein